MSIIISILIVILWAFFAKQAYQHLKQAYDQYPDSFTGPMLSIGMKPYSKQHLTTILSKIGKVAWANKIQSLILLIGVLLVLDLVFTFFG